MSRTNRSAAAGDGSQPPIHRLECSVDWPPGHAASYLLPGDERVLVDAGAIGDEAERELRNDLAAVDCEPSDIDHLLVTHAHSDHVGQVRTIREAGDVTVYAPELIKQRWDRSLEAVRDATRANLREAGVAPDRLEPSVDRLVEAHRSVREALPLEAVDVWIERGDRLAIGDFEIEPIYAPGHHVTHFCYGTTVADERVLLSGDVAIDPFRAAAIHVNFDDGVTESIDAFRDALERLQEYSFDRVYPGHGPVHDRFDAAVERSLADLEERIRRSFEALEPTGSTPVDVADAETDDPYERARVLPEIVGSLAHLEKRGRDRSDLVDDVRVYERVDNGDNV
ncbi:MBL fold metallo-hydrolase [Natrinema marinum]|uniref:MBL fold metallo-hydrolase n=1 Tax=Natrinema marinum TaxID=2961598 RepID=UPI0020C87CB1|nr:MBL fold metallo-hydrolase [Natrinema marinum]